MFPLHHPRSLYAAFDIYPSAKGAATHIYYFAQTLFEKTGGGWLHTLGEAEYPVYQQENNVEITRFTTPVQNYLERAEQYSLQLSEAVASQQHHLELCHFRDPWSGLAVLSGKSTGRFKTVFEVNGLPSIELPYRYPRISAATLSKIRHLEELCLAGADAIVVPSPIILENLAAAGVDKAKITVIANGATLPEHHEHAAFAPAQYIIYFGALQSWQGVEGLLKAFCYLSDFESLKLVICASVREKAARPLQRYAMRLGIDKRIIWQYRLSKHELQQWINGALFSVAPLTECSRNLAQGCCPLKILESMACGVPVVASDLPAVRQLVEDRQTGKLVRADRPAELARMMRLLLEHPDYCVSLGKNARAFIAANFTWAQKQQELASLYDQLVG